MNKKFEQMLSKIIAIFLWHIIVIYYYILYWNMLWDTDEGHW